MKNKKLLTGMLATVLSVSMLCSNANMLQAQETTQASEIATQTEDEVILNDETGIPDKNLYQVILADVDSNEDGVLTVSEAQQMYEVFGDGAGIKDLTGLEHCPNIYCLYLEDNEIEDISVLKHFEKMSDLYLSNNQISDISVLKDFIITANLALANNQISDISALENLKGDFFSFDLSNNQISDISVLNSELSPTCIDLSNNQITDISSLNHLTDAWYLILSNNKISDISVLNENLEVGHLMLANNQITDITPLSTMTIKTTLDLSNNNIRDISALDPLKEKENPCEIITDGNPIGEPEPEQPEEDIPSEDETPSEPTEPETPSENETPSEPTEPETPSEDETPSEPTEPQKPSKPIYNADDFAELLETQNIVVKPNDYVTITFEKGSKLNDTNGKTEFDFTTTITTDFTNAKLPTFITENSFITKVSYTYSGVLPSTANIKIFVGTEYAGKEVFYFLLNEDGTFNKNEVQKVKVNEDGSIIVTQEHCSDYVVTTENPETLYKATQTPEQPKDENTNNTENNENTSNNNANNNTTKEESPKTSDNSQFVLLSIMMISLSAFVVLARKIYKRA